MQSIAVICRHTCHCLCGVTLPWFSWPTPCVDHYDDDVDDDDVDDGDDDDDDDDEDDEPGYFDDVNLIWLQNWSVCFHDLVLSGLNSAQLVMTCGWGEYKHKQSQYHQNWSLPFKSREYLVNFKTMNLTSWPQDQFLPPPIPQLIWAMIILLDHRFSNFKKIIW